MIMLAIYHFVQNFFLTLVTHKELLKILNQHRHSSTVFPGDGMGWIAKQEQQE